MNKSNELDFLRAYKDCVFHFNRLDRNLGYCLRYCLKSKGTASPEKWILSSFESKVKMIIALANLTELQDSFDTWHEQVKRIQHFRKVVTYGSWEWNEGLPRPIHFHAPGIENGKGVFATEEFQRRLDQLKRISENFIELSEILKASIDQTTEKS